MLAGLLVFAAVIIGVAGALVWSRSAGRQAQHLGSVSERWLSLHRTES